MRYCLFFILVVCLIGVVSAQISVKVPTTQAKDISYSLLSISRTGETSSVTEADISSTKTVQITFAKKGLTNLSAYIQVYPASSYSVFPDFSYRTVSYVKASGGQYEGYTEYGKSKYEPWAYYFRTLAVDQRGNYVRFLLGEHVTRQAWVLETSYDAFNEAVVAKVNIGVPPDVQMLLTLGKGVCERCAERG